MKSWLNALRRLPVHAVGASLCLVPVAAQAQLVDITQAAPYVYGGGIGKSLADEIGSGRGDDATEWSSMYVIARDPVISTTDDGRYLATYSATLPGTDLPTAEGEDAWGNRTPVSLPGGG